MSTPVPTNPNPFVDPNNALRQFNQYFGDLRKQYGEDAIRQVGFEPKEFQDLQSSLRKLQLDPRATPEQHREAYMQARDTLARRLTTPLEATRSYSMVSQPKPAPSPSVGSDGMVIPVAVQSPNMKSPTQEQLYSYARAVGQGETGQWDPVAGAFLMTGTGQPIRPQGGLTQAQQPQPPVIPLPPSGMQRNVIDNRIGPNFGKPMQPEGLQGIASILGRFFDKGIGNDPMQPRFIGKHFTGDAPEPGMTYIETGEGLVPVPINDMPMRPSTGPGLGGGIGAFLGRPGQVSQGAGMPPGMGVLRERIGNMLNPQPRQPSGVDNSTFMAGDPNFRFGQTPQQMAPNAQGMAMGGLMNKYYGGEC